MRIASWNIAGGRTITSQNSDALTVNNDREQIGYFVKALCNTHPQVIALQEVHKPLDASRLAQSDNIAEELGMQVTTAQSYGNSHIEQGQQLSLANLSEYPIKKTIFHLLPNPNLTVNRSDGQVWRTLDVGFLISDIDYQGETIRIANGHMIPLHYFDRNYLEPEFQPVRDDLTGLFTQIADVPTIIAGDFNYPDLNKLIPGVFANNLYLEAFREDTTPIKGQQDHVLLSQHWTLKKSEVKKVDTDHYLCIIDGQLR